VAHDSGGDQNVESVLSEYSLAEASITYQERLGGALLDTQPYPPNGCPTGTVCIGQQQIEAELTRFVEAKHLQKALEDPTHDYTIVLPPNVNTCVGSPERGEYCAFTGSADTTARCSRSTQKKNSKGRS
jgi:hypothetical protein